MLYHWATKTPLWARSSVKFHIKKQLSLSPYRVQNLSSLLYYIYKHEAIDIADPNSMYNLKSDWADNSNAHSDLYYI